VFQFPSTIDIIQHTPNLSTSEPKSLFQNVC
jgi:hypothetical protein